MTMRHDASQSEDREALQGEIVTRAEESGIALAAIGGVLGAVLASSCCILPLALFSLGAGGAWLGNLAALSPYQPAFIAVTAAALGFGFYKVYRRPAEACDDGQACARPLPRRLIKLSLWSATALVAAAAAFPYVAPTLLGV